jgi:hypothetical protein
VDATGARRTDGYLYGHPDGRSSRFRSPAEFFEHLAWLATPLSKGRCICKICAGKGGETQDDGTGVAVKETKPAHQNQNQTQMKPTNTMPSVAKGMSFPANSLVKLTLVLQVCQQHQPGLPLAQVWSRDLTVSQMANICIVQVNWFGTTRPKTLGVLP